MLHLNNLNNSTRYKEYVISKTNLWSNFNPKVDTLTSAGFLRELSPESSRLGQLAARFSDVAV